ncbi:helix-turn-helix domain-containing protein [Dictyobacter aurantiacus]|uniref:HTH-type transcriptional activator RhaR n=1 Tax=Dictyobacter aurantiacus TaxID=1936993 RepID=A0A401ZEA4_9CHLR|nr:AraC family transcriptional regulator [Dictyobacter aurantiacus]GCE05195.1 HTH-type transcriptional activator RhaR [Dictyobacter aurantiacus]
MAVYEQLHYRYEYRSFSTARQALQRCFFTGIVTHPRLPLGIRRESYEQGNDTGLHKHEDFYALYVVRSGSGVHLINDHPYAITRGNVYVLSPGTIHAYRHYCQLVIDAFYFQPELFQPDELLALRSLSGFWRLFIASENLQHPVGHEEVIDHHLHLSPEKQTEIEREIAEIHGEYTAASVADAVVLVRGQFFRMLIHLARWQNEQGEGARVQASLQSDAQQKMGLASILHFCEENYHEPLSVPQLAARMFLSPSRFSEIFSREVGMSPAAYIKQLRLEKVQTLLRTTVLSTTSIAHQVGFRDSAQLARVFRSTFHLTPTAYRRSFRIQQKPE